MNGVSNCANAAKGSLAHSQVAQANNITNCSDEWSLNSTDSKKCSIA